MEVKERKDNINIAKLSSQIVLKKHCATLLKVTL